MESAWVKERVVHMMLLLGLWVKVMMLLLLLMVGKITSVCVHGWPRSV
jgi:hypothetical protein